MNNYYNKAEQIEGSFWFRGVEFNFTFYKGSFAVFCGSYIRQLRQNNLTLNELAKVCEQYASEIIEECEAAL